MDSNICIHGEIVMKGLVMCPECLTGLRNKYITPWNITIMKIGEVVEIGEPQDARKTS